MIPRFLRINKAPQEGDAERPARDPSKGPIVRAVERWGDHWSVSQEIGPHGGTAFDSDLRDYHFMRSLISWTKGTRDYVERRAARRRLSD